MNYQDEDHTRKMLNIIRESNNNTNKSIIKEQEENDPTRKMLNVIRESNYKTNKKGLLREQGLEMDDPTLDPIDQMEPTDGFETAETGETGESVEERELEKDEFREEQDKFRQSVHNRVEFNKFKLYPESQNVEFGGTFTDSRIEWFYSLDDSTGVYISAELLQLRDETLEVIKKLVGYYKAWSDEWANRIAEEYNSSKDSDTAPMNGGLEPGDDLPDETEEPMM